jgi:hypothetical protein
MESNEKSRFIIRVEKRRDLQSEKNRYLKRIKVFFTTLLTVILLAASFIAYGVDSNNDTIDDNLSASAATFAVQRFPDTGAGETATMTEIDFNDSAANALMTGGATINGVRLYGANANQTFPLGTASGSFGNSAFSVFGGAGATGRYPAVNSDTGWTISFTSTQRYVGFWWSAGNAANRVQLLDASGATLLDPQFTTAGVVRTVLENNACPARPANGSYPSGTLTGSTWRRYCGNPNTAYQTPTPNYVAEPYAFVHLRYSNGFRGIRFSGTGFEFDNVTVSETVPTEATTESAVSNNAINANVPPILPVDPRVNAKLLPGMNLLSSTNAHICISQVANAAGGTLSGDATITVGRTTNTADITATITTNLWRFSGTRANLQTQIPAIQIQGLNSQALVPSESKFIRIHLSSDTALAGCTDSQVNQIVEIRPVGLTNSLRKGTIQLK